jgi:hypothetical protein
MRVLLKEFVKGLRPIEKAGPKIEN